MTISSDSNTTIVPFLLREDNYQDWKIFIGNYLLAQDLWDIVESGDDIDLLSYSDEVRNWRKKNAAALHAIHTTSSSDIFAQIKEIKSAKDVWYKLAKMAEEWQSKARSETSIEQSDGEEDEINEMAYCAGREKEADKMIEMPHFVELKMSICKGDWDVVKQFFVFHKYPLNAIILSDYGYTALHVAIMAGQDMIAEELVKMMSETDLEIKTASGGLTALSLVAFQGRTNVAKCLVQKNKKLLTIEDNDGYIPVCRACGVGHKEMTDYLYSVTPFEVLQPENGNHGICLIRGSISNKMLGLKLKLPTASSIEIRIAVADHHQSHNQENIKIQVFGGLCRLGLIVQNLLGFKHIYDLKLRHIYALEVLRCMCNYVSTFKFQQRDNCQVAEAIFEATKRGIVEFVIELLKVNQPITFHNEDRRHVFMVAIQQRQENIFNLFYGVHEPWKAVILNYKDKNENNMLHVAGEIAPDFQLARISSAALQMQRELRWFKEVERIVPEWCKEHKNCSGETPYEVFSKNHKELAKAGEKWMKGIASSFIIVGTLIVTIMFAAAFTVPGSNDQDTGFPIFLQKRSFMIFIISDAISFFAASTSVLMFLGILTSRFAQEDFHMSLPKKLIIGLSSLFISSATMMVSFSAALLIMLQDRWWAIIPIILMASIPVELFVWLEFPLLIENFVLTYSSGNFDRKMKHWL